MTTSEIGSPRPLSPSDAGPSYWQRDHLAPGLLNDHLSLALQPYHKAWRVVPSVDGRRLFEPSERGGKGKSPVRCVEGGSSTRFSLHPAHNGHVRLTIREPDCRPRNLYIPASPRSPGVDLRALQTLSETQFDQAFPAFMATYRGYQPSGMEVVEAADANQVLKYTLRSAWERISACEPFVGVPVPSFEHVRLWRMRDVMPDIIGHDKEKLKRAFYTASEVVFITRVHAPLFKRLTTSSITRLRAYIAPINGELQGPFSLAVSEDYDTRYMTVRGRVMLRDAWVQNPELTQTYTHYSIHGKRAAWILE